MDSQHVERYEKHRLQWLRGEGNRKQKWKQSHLDVEAVKIVVAISTAVALMDCVLCALRCLASEAMHHGT